MRDPLATTFETLATTGNASAVAPLIAALDVSCESICLAAVRALIRRFDRDGLVEVVRRMDELPPAIWDEVDQHPAAFERTLRPSLQSDDPRLRRNALGIMLRVEAYSEAATLLGTLEALTPGEREQAGLTIEVLVSLLYDHLLFGRRNETEGGKRGAFLRDAHRLRHEVLGALGSACEKFNRHGCLQAIESLLILGDVNDLHVQRVLRDGPDEARRAAASLLQSSTHRGILALLIESLSQNHPAPAALRAVDARTDATFVKFLLAHWPKKPTPFQDKNLAQLRQMAWLAPAYISLQDLPPEVLPSLIRCVETARLSDDRRFELLEWLVQEGSIEARVGAAEALASLDRESAKVVVLDSLSAPQADVQAWATHQLRSWMIPNAMKLLLERIDSSVPAVREAARGELADFNMQRVLELFDQLDPCLYEPVARLLEKVDLHAVDTLLQELRGSIRRKRVRAARVARALGWLKATAPALIEMSRDVDPLIRRTAAAVLAELLTPEAAAALDELRRDPSQLVRDTARAAQKENVNSLAASVERRLQALTAGMDSAKGPASGRADFR